MSDWENVNPGGGEGVEDVEVSVWQAFLYCEFLLTSSQQQQHQEGDEESQNDDATPPWQMHRRQMGQCIWECVGTTLRSGRAHGL